MPIACLGSKPLFEFVPASLAWRPIALAVPDGVATN